LPKGTESWGVLGEWNNAKRGARGVTDGCSDARGLPEGVGR